VRFDKISLYVTLLLCLCAIPAFAQVQVREELPFMKKEKKDARWVAYYGEKAKAETFLDYDAIVFDGLEHPSLRPLLNRNKSLLGYISLGEAEKFRFYFPALQEKNLLLEESRDWPGHYAIDIRKAAWTKMVLENIIPHLITAGFNGVLLDTLDTSIALERRDPKTYAGMQQAAVNLVKAIRIHYPRLHIMMNRAFEILPQVEQDIDMELAESIYTVYNFKTAQYSRVPDVTYLSLAKMLQETQTRAPRLHIFTLDYWPNGDKSVIQTIYATQRKQGFIPYVSQVDLQKAPGETAHRTAAPATGDAAGAGGKPQTQ
jgi:uncharacterized protein (TIGR01370 family)